VRLLFTTQLIMTSSSSLLWTRSQWLGLWYCWCWWICIILLTISFRNMRVLI